MKKRDMIVRQGIKTTAKSHKMLVPYVNGEMTFNGLFEDNHKTWKVGSKEYNKMAKIPFEDLEPQDQITKYNLISIANKILFNNCLILLAFMFLYIFLCFISLIPILTSSIISLQ